MSDKDNIEKDQIHQEGKESPPRPEADVRLDTELSVAELVELNRNNLPGTFEEAQQQVEQLSQSADAKYMRVGAHILAVELEARFYRYGYGSKADYAEDGLGLASTTWRRYYDAAKVGYALRDLDQRLLMGHCLALADLRVKNEQELLEKAPDVIANAMAEGPLTAESLKAAVLEANGVKSSGDGGDDALKKANRRLRLIYNAKKALTEESVSKDMNKEQKAALEEYSKAATKMLQVLG